MADTFDERYMRWVAETRRGADDYLSEPLSAETHRVGQRLLLIAVLALATTLGGLVPSRIGALGIEFEAADQRRLLWLLALVVFYYLVTFGVRGLVDWMRWSAVLESGLATWRVASMAALAELLAAMGKRPIEKLTADDVKLLKDSKEDFTKAALRRQRILRIRAWFEFLVPVAAGVTALVLLLRWAPAEISGA